MAKNEKVFKFYSDPGHGWLAVPIKDLAPVNLKVTDFSPYSYIRGKTVYLEEDCDATMFILQYQFMNGGEKPKYIEKYTDGTHPIRSYDRIPT